MRFFHAAGAAVLLCACSPQIPDSAATFGQPAMQGHAASGISPVIPPRQVVSMPPQQHRPQAAPLPVATAEAPPVSAQTAPQTVTASAPATSTPVARQAPPQSQAQPSGAITEQDFPTLLARQGAEPSVTAASGQVPTRVEAVAAQPLPERPSDMPNVVHFALSTTHSVGQQQWRRSGLTTQNHARNCAGFVSADLAQEEFLRRGGPERDPLNLDPDGDGFACWWSPEPFRAAARAAN